MRRVRLVVVATVICLLGPVVLWVSPAAAAPSISVTPNTNLKDGEPVTVDGSGFPASVQVGVAECASNTIPVELAQCSISPFPVTTSSTGTFSSQLLVYIRPFSNHPGCQVQTCYVGAAVTTDIDNTAAFAPIAFKPGQPDGRIIRRSDGQIFDDNVYFSNQFSDQHRSHTIAPGDYWVYALQVQNDGPNTDDIRVSAPSPPGTQFFYGYYDLTAEVTQFPGLVFPAMAPGEVRPFALRFHAPADAAQGTSFRTFVDFISNSSGARDILDLRVVVQTPTL